MSLYHICIGSAMPDAERVLLGTRCAELVKFERWAPERMGPFAVVYLSFTCKSSKTQNINNSDSSNHNILLL